MKKIVISSKYNAINDRYSDILEIEKCLFKYNRFYKKDSSKNYSLEAEINFENNIDFENIIQSSINSLNENFRYRGRSKLHCSITFFEDDKVVNNFNIKGSFIDNHLWQLNSFTYLLEEGSKSKFGNYVRKFPQNEKDGKMYLDAIENYKYISK